MSRYAVKLMKSDDKRGAFEASNSLSFSLLFEFVAMFPICLESSQPYIKLFIYHSEN